jgi:hypothetical protein
MNATLTSNQFFYSENQTMTFSYTRFPVNKINVEKIFKIMRKLLFILSFHILKLENLTEIEQESMVLVPLGLCNQTGIAQVTRSSAVAVVCSSAPRRPCPAGRLLVCRTVAL